MGIYNVCRASPRALQLIDEGNDKPKGDTFVNTHHRSKYKFEQIDIGYCFTVPFAEANENSLRQMSLIHGKKLKRKFTVIKHNDHGLFEIARIG